MNGLFINDTQTKKILKISDSDFYRLKDVIIENGSYKLKYEFIASFDQNDILNNNATKLRITAYNYDFIKDNALNDSQNATQEQLTIDGRLYEYTKIKEKLRNLQNNVLNDKPIEIDLTSKINNNIVGKKNIENISEVSRTSIVFEKTTGQSTTPVSNRNLYQGTTHTNANQNVSFLMQQIIKGGKDPSQIIDDVVMAKLKFSDLYRGIKKNNQKKINDEAALDKKFVDTLFPFIYNNVVAKDSRVGSHIVTIVTQQTSEKEIKLPFEIKLSNIVENLFIRLELINDKGITIDNSYKILKSLDDYNEFITITKKPIVNISLSEDGRNITFYVTQQDKNAEFIKIYEKKIDLLSSNDEQYTEINKSRVPYKSGTSKITIPNDKVKSGKFGLEIQGRIFRVISLNKDEIAGNEFTNVVLKGTNRIIEEKNIALITTIVEDGILISVNDIKNISSLKILKKNHTRKDRRYSILDGSYHVQNYSNEYENFSIIDKDLKDDSIYEYALEVTYKTECKRIIKNTLIQYKKMSVDIVDTKVYNQKITSGSLNEDNDVSFDIKTSIKNSDLEKIRIIFQNQGYTDLFMDQLKNGKYDLQSLIAYKVTRLNIKTGLREEFGTIPYGTTFSDSDYRNIRKIERLMNGYTYRYEINTLIRSAETTIKDVLTKTDEETLKEYEYSPRKFFNPITLKTGNLIHDNNQRISAQDTNYPYDDMTLGNLGDVYSYEVSFANASEIAIKDLIPQKINRKRIKLSWAISGSDNIISRIDYFIILLEEDGCKFPIGKAWHKNSNSCSYIHNLDEEEIGDFRYSVIPVYTNYTVGNEISADYVIRVEK